MKVRIQLEDTVPDFPNKTTDVPKAEVLWWVRHWRIRLLEDHGIHTRIGRSKGTITIYQVREAEEDLLEEEPVPEHDLHHVDVAKRLIHCKCGETFHTLKEIAEHCGLGDLYNERNL